MQAREVIRVPGFGTPGNHGSGPGDYAFRQLQAQYGCGGLHGQSATSPTPGTAGQNINVRLAYLDSEPDIVQVAGEGTWTGKIWKVNRDQNLFLDCRGGDGGRGGQAEDGQQGGQGSTGRNATKYRDADNGGMGGSGGDGGYGTNGANGADAGNVFFTVGEDDLDLLVACSWDTSGGKGGASGTHGMPGDGGIGGHGGNGCTWTERHGDRVVERSRPRGANGSQGPPGKQPPIYLSGGNAGRPGMTQIRVLKRDLTEATYPGRYELEVVSFDVIDEGEDGVNEPGEHLLVRNIKVKNKGKMPSPGIANPIKLLIQGTNWLHPIESEPVEVPFSILPNGIVDVPGTLRAYIRNETITRPPGQALKAEDQVTLIATFCRRLNRSLPDFSGSVKYTIRYPLELTPPRALECVQQGDRVRFSWTLRNISSKPYGTHGLRWMASRFSDPERVFDLPYSDEQGRHQATDAPDMLEPGQEAPIEQDFIVSATAMEYSYANLQLELLLADPHMKDERGSAKIRSITYYNLTMQVAGVYQYDPLSRFLLVVNSRTPNWAIHQLIKFIRNELRLGLDIFNISIAGSYIDNSTQECVLQRYKNKSIIIYGNTFPLFDQGVRSPWQLLDPSEICSLSKGGTNFLFYGVDNEPMLRQWAANITFSTNIADREMQPATLLMDLITKVQGENQTTRTTDINLRQFQSKPGAMSCCGTTSPDEHAVKSAVALSKALPLRRFMATPDPNSVDPLLPNIFLIEGLPKCASVLSSSVLPVQNTNDVLSEYHRYSIIRSLPFYDLTRLFWNAWGNSNPDTQGNPWFPVTLLYAGTGWQETRGLNWAGAMIDSKTLSFVSHAIQTVLTTESTQFLLGKPPPANSLSQLPNMCHFLDAPCAPLPAQQLNEQPLLLPTLATILGSLLNIGFGEYITNIMFSTAPKRKLKDQVEVKLAEALSRVCSPGLVPSIMASVRTSALATKEEIKAAGPMKDISPVLQRRFAALTGVNAGLTDFTSGKGETIAVTFAGMRRMKESQATRMNELQAQQARASLWLQPMVNPEVEEQAPLEEKKIEMGIKVEEVQG